MYHIIKVLLGPVLGVLIYLLLMNSTQDHKIAATGGVGIWMAIWWITEAVNIYFTSLIPITFLPFLGVVSMKELGPMYMPDIIFFFIGGFLLAFALEKWDIHKRIALKILLVIGNSPQRLLLGFMLTSYFLSMWILNTAVVMMLLPAAMAVFKQIQEKDESNDLSTPFLLGIAYAASIGGTATLIGTAPNLYFMDFFNENMPQYEPVTFGGWFMVALPASVIFVFSAYWVIQKRYLKSTSANLFEVEEIKSQYEELGKINTDQWIVSLVFGVTVVLWFTAKQLDIGSFHFPGWLILFDNPTYIKESTIAMLAAFILVILPSRTQKGNLLDWDAAKKIPLGIIFLFGGGFALAKVIGTSGLGLWLGDQLVFLKDFNPILVVIGLAMFMTFFTELTSNTASTILILPILMPVAQNVAIHPMIIMMPVVMSASFAFMLPVATPPNTIVYGTEKIKIKDMIRTGLILNLMGVAISLLAVLVWGRFIFDW
ncbi:MAG: sodium-dependent dicarboxylate transporter 2/3/5 [Salibacteraceae bacterium]|jgi:sodium-dependent dicarboxylate transporter 2/3/5